MARALFDGACRAGTLGPLLLQVACRVPDIDLLLFVISTPNLQYGLLVFSPSDSWSCAHGALRRAASRAAVAAFFAASAPKNFLQFACTDDCFKEPAGQARAHRDLVEVVRVSALNKENAAPHRAQPKPPAYPTDT